ncbi:MAG TPA: alpha/beta hydrolase, partial [Yinghuangia sp.]|nr:alpha/beta hydrolase [Yinghuangia sp.]
MPDKSATDSPQADRHPYAWTPTRHARNGDVDVAYDTLSGSSGGAPLLLVMGLATARFWWPAGLCDAF